MSTEPSDSSPQHKWVGNINNNTRYYAPLEEAAAFLGVKQDYLLHIADEGGIKKFQDQADWRFRASSLEQLKRTMQEPDFERNYGPIQRSVPEETAWQRHLESEAQDGLSNDFDLGDGTRARSF